MQEWCLMLLLREIRMQTEEERDFMVCIDGKKYRAIPYENDELEFKTCYTINNLHDKNKEILFDYAWEDYLSTEFFIDKLKKLEERGEYGK